MTGTSKYAFAKKSDAEMFVKENGGKVTDFAGAYKVALDDFSKDMAMVKKNRETRMYKAGQTLFETKCDQKKIAGFDAHTMGDLKAMIRDSKACGEGLTDSQLQAVMLYYWDIKTNRFYKH